jgi:hypothetical protein
MVLKGEKMKLKEIKEKIESVKKNNSVNHIGSPEEISILQIDILYKMLLSLKRIESTLEDINQYLP